jgi:hypothetical protein
MSNRVRNSNFSLLQHSRQRVARQMREAVDEPLMSLNV